MLTAREDRFFLIREASSTSARNVHNRWDGKQDLIPIREELPPTGSSKHAHT
jgi:hypothetical protein